MGVVGDPTLPNQEQILQLLLPTRVTADEGAKFWTWANAIMADKSVTYACMRTM